MVRARITSLGLSLIIKLISFTGIKPPEEIIDNERLNELNNLIPEKYNIKKIIKVNNKYITLIFNDCFKVSFMLKFIKFVKDFFKLLSNISISNTIDIKKYKPPNH